LFFLLVLYATAQPVIPSSISQQFAADKDEVGILYHRHYSTKEYGASFQSWGGLQGKDGVLFFCNGDGVLSYDGKTWSLAETPTQSVIRSLGMDASGKIYVGALDDLGFLEREKNGKHIFVSMLGKIKPDLRRMGNVWQIFVHNNLIYFNAENGIFSWDGERFSFWAWPDPETFHKSFFWRNDLYTSEESSGLLKLHGDKFLTAPGGDFFKDKRIYSVFPLANNKILLATRFHGLFVYDGQHIEAFRTEADAYIKQNQIYAGLMLSDSSLILGTRQKGVVMIDRHGGVSNLITKENGLPYNSVLGLILDRQNNLWITLENGITKVEIKNGLSFFDVKNGFEGSANDFERHDGKLYTTTSAGLFVLRPRSFPNYSAHFERVQEINVRCWNLLRVGKRLLVTSDKGLYEIYKGKINQITNTSAHDLHVFKGDSTRIIVAINNDLQTFKLVNDRWAETGFIKDVRLDNISFNETHPGRIWLATYSQGVGLLSFPEKNGAVDYENPTVKFFGPKDGLPEGFIKMNTIGGEEVFRIGTASRIFKFNDAESKFYEDTLFTKRFNLEDDVFPITNDRGKGVLFKTRKRGKSQRHLIYVTPSGGDQFVHHRFDISRIFENVHVTSFLERNVVWQGGSDGISRFDMSEIQAKDTVSFNTYIDKVILLGDSVFYQGVTGSPQNVSFSHASSSFRFEFTSTNFSAEEANEFQYKLEGYDDDWSDWTKENVKEYSRLWEGNYKFLVRSRNFAQQIGSTDEFAFVVAPPWYRSFYAYAAYFIGAAFIVWGIVRWRSYKLLQEKNALQAEVAHQTQEIRQQNIQLAEQSEELRVNAEQLKELDKMKSNFFVNISHEFRTPLSLILSPLEKYIQGKETSQVKLTELERMHRNAKRLQQLINQLLDLAKLESGGMKLINKQSDFIYFLRVLTSSFESLAESRNIQFNVEIPIDSYPTFFDTEKLETVLHNLLSNAFKFTPDGGKINFRLAINQNQEKPLSISISDTGPGIPESELNKIFDRFYQVDSSSSREFEGSGIGLSLVRELVALMNGSIAVESSPGNGATFTVQLPLKLFADTEMSTTSISSTGELIPADNFLPTNGKQHEEMEEAKVAPADALILLVEDNADLRSYLKESLEDDYQIMAAENGQVGLEKALELIPDLILSDMMMPIMDGFTLCTKIRGDERTSHIPFILLTARTTIESKLEGLELGADEYLTKPFNIKEIKVRIKNLLEQRKNLRNSFSRELTIQPKNISVTSVDERFLNHALEIMEAHIADPQFSVERFAEEIGMSRKNLLRKIKALTDQSVNEFIRNFRLQRSAQFISAKTGTISEIAYRVGFNNLSYFSKCFKELFGVLPNEYEKV
jgi:signal transduction histidine kinase/DNA-binding response OmpR family regulator